MCLPLAPCYADPSNLSQAYKAEGQTDRTPRFTQVSLCFISYFAQSLWLKVKLSSLWLSKGHAGGFPHSTMLTTSTLLCKSQIYGQISCLHWASIHSYYSMNINFHTFTHLIAVQGCIPPASNNQQTWTLCAVVLKLKRLLTFKTRSVVRYSWKHLNTPSKEEVPKQRSLATTLAYYCTIITC